MIWVLRLVSLVRDVRLWSIEEVLGQLEIRGLFFGPSQQPVEKAGWVLAPREPPDMSRRVGASTHPTN